jgi:hypothetical protein
MISKCLSKEIPSVEPRGGTSIIEVAEIISHVSGILFYIRAD